MGRLSKSQSNFDHNHDGKLGFFERTEWYSRTYPIPKNTSSVPRREHSPLVRCPNCGSPVTCHGTSWECGWCGDSGSYSAPDKRLPELERSVYHVLVGMRALYDSEDAANEPFWKLIIHCQVSALQNAENRSRKNKGLLSDFWESYPVCTAAEIRAVAEKGKIPFDEEYHLSKERIGNFWTVLLPRLPVYDAYSMWPDWLFEIFAGCAEIESLFTGEDSDEILEDRQDMFAAHWQQYSVFSIDREEVEAAVRRWDFSKYPFADRDLLVSVFYEEFKTWDAEKITQSETVDLLCDTYERTPERAVEMWRYLLNSAEENLSIEPDAQYLIELTMETVWLDGDDEPELLIPILDALKDEHFSRQIFCCAYVGNVQICLLSACRALGRLEQQQALYALLQEKPSRLKDWEEELAEVMEAMLDK